MKIPCICIDDKNKPLEIPSSRWVKEGEEYHVVHVYNQHQQKGVRGVELSEFDISDCVPYNCYRLDRFAFTKENLSKMIELLEHCTELDNIDIGSILEKLTLINKLHGAI